MQEGGGFVPTLTFDVYNFFISKLYPPNLVTFPNIYLEQLGIASACPSSFTLPWHHFFTGFFFQNLMFTFTLKNYILSEARCTFLYYFRLALLISVTLWSIVANFKGSEKIKKSKMADPRWPPF